MTVRSPKMLVNAQNDCNLTAMQRERENPTLHLHSQPFLLHTHIPRRTTLLSAQLNYNTHNNSSLFCSDQNASSLPYSIWSDSLYVLGLGVFPKASWHQSSVNANLSTHFVFIVFQIMSQINTVQLRMKKKKKMRDKVEGKIK